MVVEFQDEHKYQRQVRKDDFIKGNFKNPYDRSVYGVGYFGVGKYRSKENGRHTKAYKRWHDMMMRVYKKDTDKEPYYKTCVVCDEWHNFQNFAKWFDENYYEIPGCVMHLDKDICKKRNNIYCPQYCSFVPQDINEIFTKCNKARGAYVIGVCFHKGCQKFVAQCQTKINNKQKVNHLGYYDTETEAFDAYKQFKENYIKKIALQYKEYLPQKTFNALMEYEVLIDD